jgi:pilus assembly protein FimV
MKRTLLSTLVITSALGLSTNVLALGMGELELKSTLNQPLQAEIELTNLDNLTEWEIKPSLASDGDFDRAGVEKIFFLSDIDFTIKGNRIILSSDKSVTEPFLNFLVQVNWPSGRLLREYTLLLDPPVFDETIQPLTATEVPQSTGSIAVETTKVAVAKPKSNWETEAAKPGTYKVQPNDTLWNIAMSTRPNSKVTPQQMMLAIQDGNPGAFIAGNINRLKTHQVLRIPNEQQIADRNNSQAISEVSRQNKELATAGAQLDATSKANQTNEIVAPQEGGELKLVASQNEVENSSGASGDIESGVSGTGRTESITNDLAVTLEELDSSKLENSDLKKRLSSLEEQIAALQSLVSLKDDQLASIQTLELQKEILDTNGGTTESAIDETTSEDGLSNELSNETSLEDVNSENAIAKADATGEGFIESEESIEGSDLLVDANSESEEITDFNYAEDDSELNDSELESADSNNLDSADKTVSQIQNEIEEKTKPKSIVETITSKPEFMAGIAGGLLLLLGLIGLAVKKRSAKEEDEVEADSDDNFSFTDEELNDGSLDNFDLDDFSDDELTGDIHGSSSTESEENSSYIDAAEDEAVPQTGDILAETEIYIAYGRFDQAADLLKTGIQQEPSRTDLRLKLLEVYSETDDANSFAENEQELNSLGNFEANEKALALRNNLSAPIDISELTTPETGEENGDDEFDLESLAGNDDEFADGMEFDAALDLTEENLAENSDEENFAASLDALDNSLDEDELELNSEISGDESLESSLEELDDSLEALEPEEVIETIEYEIPTEEDFAELSEEELSLDEDENQTVADEIESIEFEIEGLDESSAFDNDEVPTITELDSFNSENNDVELENLLDSDLSDQIDESNYSLDEAVLDDVVDVQVDTVAEVSEESEFDLDSFDELPSFDELADLDDLPNFESDTAEALPDLMEFSEQSIETNELAEKQEEVSQSQEIDLDALAASDDEFDFLAGTDECATKLDLARAYFDMDDIDGAKELLREVITEGNDQQKQDARSLMDSMN